MGESRELLIRDVTVVSPKGRAELDVAAGVDVRFGGGRVAEIGRALLSSGATIEGRGRALLPGLVDCHTHACWAGERVDEWERKLAGASYLELLGAGGGIMSTVRAVREASEDELVERLLRELHRMLACGTTTLEVKSGYGLRTADELKMLRAIRRAGELWPGTVVPTACIGHAIGGDREAFIDRAIGETLPAVGESFPGVTIDAYCEDGAWSLGECVRLFEAAAERGHPCRVHADQFSELGMVTEAARRRFASVDHLEATSLESLRALAQSETIGVMLPVCGLHLDGRYADGRAFVDAGGTLAIATNNNPGSAPCHSLPMVMALAVRMLGLTPTEALTAATANGSSVLERAGLAEPHGRLVEGGPGDAVLLDTADWRELCYGLGPPPIAAVVCSGSLAWSDARALS